MDRPMHLNVSYKTQDDIEASLEIDYDVIVLRSVYYPEEDAYALEQMGNLYYNVFYARSQYMRAVSGGYAAIDRKK